MGGAIRGNAHFKGRLIGDRVTAVGLADRVGTEFVVPRASMAFGYDDSRVQHTGELVRWAEFRVGRGVMAQLREAARGSLAFPQADPAARAGLGGVRVPEPACG